MLDENGNVVSGYVQYDGEDPDHVCGINITSVKDDDFGKHCFLC